VTPTNAVKQVPSPRRWQKDALKAWQSADQRGVVQVVTGGGKTTFAGLCLKEFFDAHPSGQAIIVVPTIALLDQWYVALQEDFAIRSSDIAAYSGEGTPSKSARINLMVVNTARSRANEVAQSAENLLIVDECHRVGSRENSRVLDGPHVATLGLSATPRREYDDAFEEVIEPVLGPVIYEYGYDEARRDEVIASFQLINVAVEMSSDEHVRYDKLTRQVSALVRRYHEGEDVEARMKRVLRDRASVSSNARARIPVAVRIAERNSDQRIIIFHESIRAANLIVGMLAKRGKRVAAYHSGIGPDLRRDNLRMFRRGQLDVLVSCRALDEGVNVPEAGIAIIASSTASSRQRIQRQGRVLRPSSGKDRAVIYTLYATKIEEDRLREESTRLESVERVTWLRSTREGTDGTPPAT
jgi:superfamily II DNA or RNA helicase